MSENRIKNTGARIATAFTSMEIFACAQIRTRLTDIIAIIVSGTDSIRTPAQSIILAL